jgi:hypothetical protein
MNITLYIIGMSLNIIAFVMMLIVLYRLIKIKKTDGKHN